MTSARISKVWRTTLLTIAIFSLCLPAYAKYSGGTGERNDPYQIATAEDLMLLGETPEDYDKHFILTGDIDLDPNLPGGKVFDRAVIAPALNDLEHPFHGIPFTGVFDCNVHTISHLTMTGGNYLGLFGRLGSSAEVKNLGVVEVNMAGSSENLGCLVGINDGVIIQCYSTGVIMGDWGVGGLVGINSGRISNCYSNCTVHGDFEVGGLVGEILSNVVDAFL